MPDRQIARVKILFFDRAAVIAAMDKASRAALSKAGAFIRRRARSSMRPGGKKNAVAPPGKPPRVHAGQLKQLLFFSYDPSTRSVVIGPTPFGRGQAPRLLEFGGDATIQSHGRLVRAHYRGNPFMGPALNAEAAAGNLPRAWAGSVRT